jgi:hypothetical protein
MVQTALERVQNTLRELATPVVTSEEHTNIPRQKEKTVTVAVNTNTNNEAEQSLSNSPKMQSVTKKSTSSSGSKKLNLSSDESMQDENIEFSEDD